jgi:Protein of unknown function (DUF1761)
MMNINYLAVVVAAVAAFVASFVWYSVFGAELAKISPAFAEQQPVPWKMLVILATSLVVAFVVAYVIGLAGDVTWTGAVGIGALLWLGLAATQWVNSMVGENVPLKLAAIHAGDWLLKLVLIAVIVGVWRR